MSKWEKSPVFVINKFIEYKLRQQEIIPGIESYITQLDNSTTDIVLPFFLPVQQTPEMISAYNSALASESEEGFVDLPFGTYTFSISSESDQPFMICGQITYTFFSHSVDVISEIVNYVTDLCKREDWSAADINDFYKNDDANPFEFKSIGVTQTAGPAETEDEGGRFAYMIVVHYESTYEGLNRSYSGETTFSGGLGMW